MSAAQLQREIQRRAHAQTLQASQQSILRLIATGRPLNVGELDAWLRQH